MVPPLLLPCAIQRALPVPVLFISPVAVIQRHRRVDRHVESGKGVLWGSRLTYRTALLRIIRVTPPWAPPSRYRFPLPVPRMWRRLTDPPPPHAMPRGSCGVRIRPIGHPHRRTRGTCGRLDVPPKGTRTVLLPPVAHRGCENTTPTTRGTRRNVEDTTTMRMMVGMRVVEARVGRRRRRCPHGDAVRRGTIAMRGGSRRYRKRRCLLVGTP